MSELIIGIDFSATSIHAAAYAYMFAKEVNVNLILCNVIENTDMLTGAGNPVKKQQKHSLVNARLLQLANIKNQLEHVHPQIGFKPTIRCLSRSGLVADIVNKIIVGGLIDMVVIGTHGTAGLGSFLLGAVSRELIDSTNKPLILVPPAAKIGPIKRIAFASDFNHEDDDLKSLFILIAWARALGAEVLLTHIHEDEDHSTQFTEWVNKFIIDVSIKTGYQHISYRVFRGQGYKSGLLWLFEHGNIDILGLQYRPHTFFDSLFRGSQSDISNRELPIPILVFPSP